METLVQDLRYIVRTLAKAPGFTAIAVLTLALGIGANTALFSVVNGVLLKALPYRNPNQIASVYWNLTSQQDEGVFSFPDFLDCQKQTHSFSQMAAFRFGNYNLLGAGEPERLDGEMVSAEFFPLLNIQPLLGRTFRTDEDRVGAAPVVVIGEDLWKRKFNSSPNVLGTTLNLSGEIRTIVGVVPSHLALLDPLSVDAFVPIGQWNDITFRDRRVHMGTVALTRLKPGVALAQARADIDSVAHNLAAAYPDVDKNATVTLVPLKEDTVGSVRDILLLLLGAVFFVLLIACANVANLLLARFGARAPEFALRRALGASRFRIVRQLLTESVVLATGGGVAGLLATWWGMKVILATMPNVLPRKSEIRIDAPVLLFTLAASLVTGIVFGLLPAVKAFQPELSEAIKKGGRGSTNGRHRVQRVFIVVELAFSIVLLAGAGLMVRTLAAIWKTNPGFDAHDVLTFNLTFSSDKVTNPSRARENAREATAAFEAVPGIESASGVAGALPTDGGATTMTFWVDGNPKPASESDMSVANWYAVQPGYLKVMGIPLLRGRFISSQDSERTPSVVVIDETFARQYFPNQDPIGKQIDTTLTGPLRSEIVGVVAHTKQSGLGEIERKDREPQFYYSLAQLPDQITRLFTGMGMVVRTSGDPAAYITAIRAASRNFDADQVVSVFKPMDQIVGESAATQRFAMILLSVFAGLAVLLSAVGVYGVISYLVVQRTHEIGVRIALGAQRNDVMRLILGHGMRVALLGVAIGLAAALGLTRLMVNQLYGVSANDPLTFAGVATLLTLVALAACYIPARRAIRVDPMVALRHE
jgi:predicted permease